MSKIINGPISINLIIFFNEGIQSCENAILTIQRQINERKGLSFRLKQWFGHHN